MTNYLYKIPKNYSGQSGTLVGAGNDTIFERYTIRISLHKNLCNWIEFKLEWVKIVFILLSSKTFLCLISVVLNLG